MRGIIVGTSLFKSNLIDRTKEELVTTQYGSLPVMVSGDAFLVNRHDGNRPPHSINYRANIYGLKEMGVTEIISVNCVGSLKKEIEPGKVIVPHDYINLNPVTFFDKEIKHISPEIDGQLREELIEVASNNELAVIQKGIYWQSRGPRFETAAEVRMMGQFADVVGMTMANEATLAQELDIRYASLCTIDNYANGIAGKVTYEKLMESVKQKSTMVQKTVMGLMK